MGLVQPGPVAAAVLTGIEYTADAWYPCVSSETTASCGVIAGFDVTGMAWHLGYLDRHHRAAERCRAGARARALSRSVRSEPASRALSGGRRMSRLRALAGAQLRAAPLGVLAAAAAAGLAAVVALADGAGGAHTVASLQFAAVALGSAIALLLRDPAAAITAGVPAPLWLRRGVVLAAALPAGTIAWVLLLRVAGVEGPWAGTLTLELGAVAAVGLAVAARRPAVAPAAVAAAFTAAGLVWQDWVAPSPGDHARTRVAAAVIAVAALAAYARGSRDPLSREPVGEPLGRGPRPGRAPARACRGRAG